VQTPTVLSKRINPIIIDEVQRCPELFIAIKRAVDRKRSPGKYILSGSANFLLMKNISESLAGRAVYFNIHPFTRRELNEQLSDKPFIRKFFENPSIESLPEAPPIPLSEIIKGGMPSVCLGSMKNTTNWFKGYEQTYLERDIRDLSRIGNIIPFRGLLHLAALRTGGILSISELGRDARLTSATVSNYLSIMEVSCIFYRLAPYLKNPASRLIKSPKFYMGDSGLACYLAGKEDLTDDPLKGAIVETYVAQNIVGIIDSAWPQANLYFWNIQGRHEVDFIIESGDSCIAVEVKASERWDKGDLAGLKTFTAANNGTTPVSLGGKLWAIPLAMLLH
jgi:predicted AAA+ superfamily ATPase